jgi:hypothetical protein
MTVQNVAGVCGLLAVAALGAACLYRFRFSPYLQPAIVKVTLGFLQLISILDREFSVQWPGTYRRAIHSVKVALLSVVDLAATTCALHVNWYVRLCVWTFGMLVAALGLWLWQLRQRARGADPQQQRHVLVNRLFNLAFFCYPLASPVIVAVFDCRTVDGVSYIDADYTLACAGGTYALAATWSALWTVCFLLGFPIALMLALRRRHEAVAFLEEDYRDDSEVARMWEVVDLVKKLLLSSALLSVPEGTLARIATALFASVAFLVMQVHFQPYNNVHKNRCV